MLKFDKMKNELELIKKWKISADCAFSWAREPNQNVKLAGFLEKLNSGQEKVSRATSFAKNDDNTCCDNFYVTSCFIRKFLMMQKLWRHTYKISQKTAALQPLKKCRTSHKSASLDWLWVTNIVVLFHN